MNNIRKSNIELLRIILMIMIIGLHYLFWSMGGALQFTNIGTINWYLIRIIESLFIVAVNCFILITGFFMIKKEKFKINKIIKIILELTLYSMILYIVSFSCGIQQFSIAGLIKSAIPLLNNEYWFFKIYIILYCLIPFINVSLVKLTKERYIKLLIILIICFSIWDSIVPYKIISDGGYGIVNFITLYCIGGYIRLHYKNSKGFYYWGCCYLFLGLITFGSLFIPILKGNAWSYSYLTNILGAICLLNAFSQLKIQNNKINKLSASVLGGLMIHLNPSFLNFQFNVAKTDIFWNSKFLIVHMIITCIVIAVIVLSIDIIRKLLLDKLEDQVIFKIKIFNIEI